MKYFFLLTLLLFASSARAAFEPGSSPPGPDYFDSHGASGLFGFAGTAINPLPEYGNQILVTNYVVVVRSCATGKVVARKHSDPKGLFKIPLRPGAYSIRGVSWTKGYGANYGIQQVGVIKTGAFSRVFLNLDLGG